MFWASGLGNRELPSERGHKTLSTEGGSTARSQLPAHRPFLAFRGNSPTALSHPAPGHR